MQVWVVSIEDSIYGLVIDTIWDNQIDANLEEERLYKRGITAVVSIPYEVRSGSEDFRVQAKN